MIIRSEQMEVFESAAEEDFVRRLTAHLRENYATSVVRLPDQESPVAELLEETLDLLVQRSIAHARLYELSFESSISAFTALKFAVAPNFDKNSVSKLCLRDESIEPNARLDELLKVLTENQWAKIRDDYNADAWLADEAEENAAAPENITAPENTTLPEKPGLYDFAETAMSGGKSSKPAAKDPDFADTVRTVAAPKKPDGSVAADFSKAMFNIDLTRE